MKTKFHPRAFILDLLENDKLALCRSLERAKKQFKELTPQQMSDYRQMDKHGMPDSGSTPRAYIEGLQTTILEYEKAIGWARKIGKKKKTN